MEIKLGNKVKCIVSGLTGIAYSRLEYLNGCIQFGVMLPVDKDGNKRDVEYVDQSQLQIISKGITAPKNRTEGIMRGAPKH